ncbi:MAG: hypothetical protein ABIR94_17975, partial [Rubrivivax sp.]
QRHLQQTQKSRPDAQPGDGAQQPAQVLKGALLFSLWYDEPHRPTRDGTPTCWASAPTMKRMARRQTALPIERPFALTRQFGEDPAKQRQWQAFLNRNQITAGSLADTVSLIDVLLWPPTEVAAAKSQATATWHPETGRWV